MTDDKVFALSAQGSLFTLDANTGQKLWDVDLVADHQAIIPFWGFTSMTLVRVANHSLSF